MSMTDQQQSTRDFLMGGGYKSAKFETVGQVWKGTVVSLDLQQQRDFKTGALKYWDSDGRPMMQLRVVLQTDARDDENDDGLRAVYLKGESQKAVREAVKKAGAESIEEGGTLALAYTGDGEKKGNLEPPKLYRAEYRPPQPAPSSVNVDNLI